MMKDKSLVITVVVMCVLGIMLFVGGLNFMESFRHTTKETYRWNDTYRIRETTYDGFGNIVLDRSYPIEIEDIEQ